MTQAPSTAAAEVTFSLPDVDIHALRWGRADAPHKVIALHGWLDNAASFSRLLPHVQDVDCVALDLAGHGRSSGRAGHSAYNIWEDLRDVRQIAEQLGWASFYLLGHSRGAAVGMLYGGTFPEQIRGAFLIDGLLPLPGKASELPANLAESLRAMQRTLDAPPRPSYFDSYEDAVAARTVGRFPLTPAAAQLLAARAVGHDTERGYFWNYDRRLKLPSEIRLTLEQSTQFLNRLPGQIAVIVASDGVLTTLAARILESGHPNVALIKMVGDHHLHLNGDASTRRDIADLFMTYLADGALPQTPPMPPAQPPQ